MRDFDLDARAPTMRRAATPTDGGGSTAVVSRPTETGRLDRVGPADILRLQRTVGNASVAQLVQRQEDRDGLPTQTGGVVPEPAEENEGGGDAGGCC
jgi:hypothetical protein